MHQISSHAVFYIAKGATAKLILKRGEPLRDRSVPVRVQCTCRVHMYMDLYMFNM